MCKAFRCTGSGTLSTSRAGDCRWRRTHSGSFSCKAETVPTSTTLLVSPRTEGLDLLGLQEPEDEILEQPEQHLPMHGRQRASRDGGGKKPLREAEVSLSDKPSGNCKQA